VPNGPTFDDRRPDPDALLEQVQRDAERARRGRLKIFFGACAGVGKTYAMLSAARAQREQGLDVVVGLVETHGRSETALLLEGLEVLPRKLIPYRDHPLPEFDLDAALARRPALLLVDELAHTNVVGARHPKRWQDVEELLTTGINVYTTVNVQHLESLNDVVGQITSIRVRETLPDWVFDRADEVTLVDLPPDELLQRLREGKVYLAEQAERAVQHFFRKGNLIALRELALRRTADRVDAQMREYRSDQAIEQVWQARERLLVCVGPDPEAVRLVRAAARLAANLKADWLAVYIETPALQRLSEARRETILHTLRLAEALGAETSTLAGGELASTLLGFARIRNVSKVVVGKSSRVGWRRLWRGAPLSERLARLATDLDVYVVGRASPEEATTEGLPAAPALPGEPVRWSGYGWAALVCMATTLLTSSLVSYLDLANVVMLYLVGICGVAFRFGHGPSVFASLLSVALFDFFCVPPRFSFSVAGTQYLLTFAVMLAVALLISQLTASLRYQVHIANYREQRTSTLHALGKELTAALQAAQIFEIGCQHLHGVFQAQVALLLPDNDDKLHPPPPTDAPWALTEVDLGIAQWVYDHTQPAGFGTDTLPASPMLYLPLRAPMRTRGVLALRPASPRQILQPEQWRLLESFAAYIGLGLERIHYVTVAHEAVLKMEAERLRTSLLSALSHDLRTPLTALVGLASALQEDAPLNEETRRELAEAIHQEARRMSSLVVNLLDMARLQAGEVKLNKQWQLLDEVVGSALRAAERLLARHQVVVSLPPDLPPVCFDAVLLERVLGNLLENAARYTPPGSRIELTAESVDGELRVTVADNGPGLPAGLEERIFDKFTRGDRESATAGVGLGLAICRTIVEAHGGRIWAENRPTGGARFVFSLPLERPPALPEAKLPDGIAAI
jgi:two-component system sensor histidine kinase KdpD